MLDQQERNTTPLHAREPGSQHIASGPASQAEQCQGQVDIKRPRRQVENDEYGAFVRRVLRA